MSGIVSINIEVGDDGRKWLQDMLEKSGIKKPQDAIAEALALFARCVQEVEMGHRIASITEGSETIIASIDANNKVVKTLLSKKILEDIVAKYP